MIKKNHNKFIFDGVYTNNSYIKWTGRIDLSVNVYIYIYYIDLMQQQKQNIEHLHRNIVEFPFSKCLYKNIEEEKLVIS